MYTVTIKDFDPASRHMVVICRFDVFGEAEAKRRGERAWACGLTADVEPKGV